MGRIPQKGKVVLGDPKVETASKFQGGPMIFKAWESLEGTLFLKSCRFFFQLFIKIWNAQTRHNSIATLPKLQGQSSPHDGHSGDQKMTGDEESQSLGPWGRAYSNSFNSQHWV